MTQPKRYVLQQDLPIIKKGISLNYDSKNENYVILGTLYKWSRGIVEGDDGTWFKLEETKQTEERITVEELLLAGHQDGTESFILKLSKNISVEEIDEKMKKMEQAIEKVLNDDAGEQGFSLPSGVNKVIASAVAGNCVFYTIQNNEEMIYFYKHDIETGKTIQLEKFPAPIKQFPTASNTSEQDLKWNMPEEMFKKFEKAINPSVTFSKNITEPSTTGGKDWEVVAIVDQMKRNLNVEEGSEFKYTPGDTILTVRRLSDGEVFTVGNSVDIKIGAFNKSGWQRFTSEITNFIIVADEMFIQCGSCSGSLEDAISLEQYKTKSPPPSSKTEPFQWTEDNVWEFGLYVLNNGVASMSDTMINFKKSKTT